MLAPEFKNLQRWQQLLLPAFPILSIFQTVRCWFGSMDLAPGSVGVQDILPMSLWGAMYFTIAVVQTVAILFMEKRGTFVMYGLALGLFIIAAGGWAIGLLAVQLRNPNDTWTLWWIWSAFTAYVAWVLLGSLESTREELRHNANRST